MALANLRRDPKVALRFTRTYGVLAERYKGEPRSISLKDVFRFSDYLQNAWQDDAAFLNLLGDIPQTRLWVRQKGAEVVIEDLWPLVRVMFSRDRWDGRTKKCASPDCPAPFFLAVRKGQKFCSQTCAVRVNVRRFREREASKRALGKGSKARRRDHAKAEKA
jgi:hypothetical protein